VISFKMYHTRYYDTCIIYEKEKTQHFADADYAIAYYLYLVLHLITNATSSSHV
jgi:hypothetical protein